MNILIDIGNSTIVVALASNDGTITHTWRFRVSSSPPSYPR